LRFLKDAVMDVMYTRLSVLCIPDPTDCRSNSFLWALDNSALAIPMSNQFYI
jgi:hypothetical protein